MKALTMNAPDQSRLSPLGTTTRPLGVALSGEALAVSYLRVSTKEQAEKGGKDEGFSIPAQRDANLQKAAQLGASVVEEFVDAG